MKNQKNEYIFQKMIYFFILFEFFFYFDLFTQ